MALALRTASAGPSGASGRSPVRTGIAQPACLIVVGVEAIAAAAEATAAAAVTQHEIVSPTAGGAAAAAAAAEPKRCEPAIENVR